MQIKDEKLREIWHKANPPVIFKRKSGEPLLVKLPGDNHLNNFDIIRNNKRHKPKWNKQFKCWETPVAWYDDLAHHLLSHFSGVYLIQLYREQQKCAPACWNALGLHCECSCMGANHGSGHPSGNWHEVSETFAFTWGDKKYASRLLLPTLDKYSSNNKTGHSHNL
ncbi:hypothetical protein LX59_00838 [Azomonas agilis]|uniref:Uncharacterized protein n=1 Tax=Azomonas agilis TaxID=116849 RepID=A0A562J0Y9_9GAMM|nr:hypothetical protein [Azomonas agilis]TWH76793.1 hypothetical protein LX59_00838 [Azomonas agilis]